MCEGLEMESRGAGVQGLGGLEIVERGKQEVMHCLYVCHPTGA